MTASPSAEAGGHLSGRATAILDSLLAQESATYTDLASRLGCSTLDVHNALWELHCAHQIDFQLSRRGQMTNVTVRQHPANHAPPTP